MSRPNDIKKAIHALEAKVAALSADLEALRAAEEILERVGREEGQEPAGESSEPTPSVSRSDEGHQLEPRRPHWTMVALGLLQDTPTPGITVQELIGRLAERGYDGLKPETVAKFLRRQKDRGRVFSPMPRTYRAKDPT